MTRSNAALLALLLIPGSVYAQQANQLLEQSRAALQAGRREQAVTLAGQAVEQDPKNFAARLFRGDLLAALGQHGAAIADYDQALKLRPEAAEVYNRRGSEHFKSGRIEASLADFDKAIELRPQEQPGHWKRGISLYYAGRFADGARQFEGYQTVDDNDVENAVWRYLCMARQGGIEAARESILKIGRDPRVPMMQVYALYRGQAKPEDVLAAARTGDPAPSELNARLFYAHLYLGLYHEAAGETEQALTHIAKAADDHKISHYMWDVANVHAQRLRAK